MAVLKLQHCRNHVWTFTSCPHNLSYLWSNDNFFWEIGSTFRDMVFSFKDEQTPLPGSPKSEIKTRLGIYGESYNLGATFILKGNFPFPYGIGETGPLTTDLGMQKFLNLSLSTEIGPFRLGVTGTNLLRLLGVKNFIAAYEGTKTAENGEKKLRYLEMPLVPYINLEWKF